MDHLPAQPEPPAVDEAALEAFVRSDAFDQFLLDCFEQGIRDAVAADKVLGIRPITAA